LYVHEFGLSIPGEDGLDLIDINLRRVAWLGHSTVLCNASKGETSKGEEELSEEDSLIMEDKTA
jgi:hypothetical protein